MADEPDMNHRVLDDLADGLGPSGPSLVIDLVRVWLSESTSLLRPILPDSGSTSDEVMRAAHALKSSSYTVGAMALGKVSSDIEVSARKGDLKSVHDQRGQVMDLYQRAKAELRARHLSNH